MREIQEPLQENKMGVMPVNRLLISMALPMMISMLVQALYNIVDSIFVGMISENALTAVSLAFPVQMLLIAMGTGTGVGINAALSKSLGEKDQVTANKAATNGIFLAAASAALFFIIGVFFSRTFFLSQTDDIEIVGYGTQYLSICCIFSVGVYTQLVFERLLQATGRTVPAMVVQIVGAVINLIFDPILIFGLLGFPRMEVAGAAAATVLGQIIAGAVAIVINLKYNREIQISFKGFRPDAHMIWRIYKVGLPSIIMQAVGSVMNYFMNIILLGFTSTAAAVFGAYYKLQSFFFMPLFGLNNGMVPIIAYNYGAGKRSRVIRVIKLSIFYAMCLMFLGLCAFHAVPGKLLLLFNASENMLAIGEKALRIISISYLFAGFCIVSGTVFQALGNGVYSLLVSVARQLIVLLPAAYLLSLTGKLDLIWWSFPIAEVMSLTVSALLLFRIYKKIIVHIPDEV